MRRLLLTGGLVGLGCVASPRAPTPGDPEPSPSVLEPTEPANEDALVPVSRDESFAPAVYLAAGVPALDRPWSAGDYVRAIRALSKLARANRLFLPRAESPRSGAVFARLVASDNLTQSVQEPNAETPAVDPPLAYSDVVPQLLALYAFLEGDDVALPREQILLVAYLLDVYGVALTTLHQQHAESASEPGNQASQSSRLSALSLAVFAGATRMLAESSRYRASDRKLLARALMTERTRIAPHLTEPDLTKLDDLMARAQVTTDDLGASEELHQSYDAAKGETPSGSERPADTDKH